MSFLRRLELEAWSLKLSFSINHNFKFHRLLLFREPGAAGLERELMQPRKLEVLRCKFFFDINHGQVQSLVDGVRADGQPVRLICYYKFMFQSSTTLSGPSGINSSHPDSFK